MSETKFTPQEAHADPETKKKALIEQLTSPEIRKFIFGTIFKFHINKTEAEDIAQKVIMNAYRAITEGRFDGSKAILTTWLHRIVANECINEIRKKKRRPEEELDETKIDNEKITGSLPSTEEIISNKEKGEKLERLINGLEPKYKKIMELYLQGYTQEEIVDKLNMPQGTVKSLTHYAKKRLFELLEQDEVEKNKKYPDA